jgi:2-polyprenyl-6-methoxyphenol hydroxylase-like FAD-dependent oxidoreductase
MAERHQVVVVGGGPVGVGLGVELGLRGIDCVVVERRKELARIPKGQNLTPRTLEHFYFWGIVDEVRAARLMPKDYPIGELTAYGTLLSEYWWGPQRTQPGGGHIRPHYYEDNDRMPQYQLEAVLRKKMTELPTVKVLFDRTAKKVEQDAGGVRVTLDSQVWPYDDEVIEADYVVGCDGSRSLVRDQLGIEQAGTNFEQRMALAVFRSPALHELLERFPKASLYRVLDPAFKGYPIVIGRVVVGETFFLLAPVPNEAQRDTFEFPALVNRAAGCAVSISEFEYTGFWDLRVSIARDYQVGRAFIAGDAAHSHPPFGGFGLNNGLEDIRNLGWKLAARLQGWGGDSLLASYSEERRPIFWEVGEDFIARGMEREGAFLARYSPEADRGEFERAWKEFAESGGNRGLVYEPHYEGSSIVAGPPGARCSAHGQFSFKARPGHHLSPQPLSGGRYLPEELGSGFCLLAFDVAPEHVRPVQDAARNLHVPLKVVTDSFAGGRQRYESRLILVRPDQHVAWVGDTLPDTVGALLSKVTGRGSGLAA